MVITHVKDSRGFDLRSLLESSARIGITVVGVHDGHPGLG